MGTMYLLSNYKVIEIIKRGPHYIIGNGNKERALTLLQFGRVYQNT